MNMHDFDQLLALMIDKGFTAVDYEKDGVRIAMKLAAHDAVEQSAPQVALPAPSFLRAKAIGTLLDRHPDAADGSLALQENQPVKAGQIVAYIRSGLCLTAIKAESAGQLGRLMVPSGSTVGFNRAVFEFFPDPSAAGI